VLKHARRDLASLAAAAGEPWQPARGLRALLGAHADTQAAAAERCTRPHAPLLRTVNCAVHSLLTFLFPSPYAKHRAPSGVSAVSPPTPHVRRRRPRCVYRSRC
jgi:hypothetical protein